MSARNFSQSFSFKPFPKNTQKIIKNLENYYYFFFFFQFIADKFLINERIKQVHKQKQPKQRERVIEKTCANIDKKKYLNGIDAQKSKKVL